MVHPAVAIGLANTLKASRMLSEMDGRQAQSDSSLMELLAGSRAAIERSRRLLSELKTRADG
jgi:hypothetical protein